MDSNQKICFVTKNGVRVSGPLSEADANVQANLLRSLTESQGEKAEIKVVPQLLG